MVKTTVIRPGAMAAWAHTSQRTHHVYRLFRLIYTACGLTIESPLILVDWVFRLNRYGPASWTLFDRYIYRILAMVMWALSPGRLPLSTVDTWESRKNVPVNLPLNKLYLSVDIPPAPKELLSAEAVHDKVDASQPCPGFWCWNASQPIPACTADAASDELVFLYLVGGAYITGHPLESDVPYDVAHVTKSPVFCCNYRKAIRPELCFPAALQDAIAAFHYLTHDRHYPARNVVILGESAGGGLAVTLCLYLSKLLPKEELPGGLVLSSPWVDLDVASEAKHASWRNLHHDFLSPERLSSAAELYVQNAPQLRDTVLLSPGALSLPGDHHTSKVHARRRRDSVAVIVEDEETTTTKPPAATEYTLASLPRSLVTCGTLELFEGSIERFCARLVRADVPVTVVRGKDKVHCFAGRFERPKDLRPTQFITGGGGSNRSQFFPKLREWSKQLLEDNLKAAGPKKKKRTDSRLLSVSGRPSGS